MVEYLVAAMDRRPGEAWFTGRTNGAETVGGYGFNSPKCTIYPIFAAIWYYGVWLRESA